MNRSEAIQRGLTFFSVGSLAVAGVLGYARHALGADAGIVEGTQITNNSSNRESILEQIATEAEYPEMPENRELSDHVWGSTLLKRGGGRDYVNYRFDRTKDGLRVEDFVNCEPEECELKVSADGSYYYVPSPDDPSKAILTMRMNQEGSVVLGLDPAYYRYLSDWSDKVAPPVQSTGK